MSKDIKKYFQYYIDAVRFRYRYVDSEPGIWSVWVMMTHERFAKAVLDKSIAEVQIELRKLTTLSEDELTECVFLSFGSSNRDIATTQISKVVKHPDQIKRITKWGGALPFIAYSADGNPQLIGSIDKRSLNPEQFHYLLSIGIDLFDLIISSLAIDKETLKG